MPQESRPVTKTLEDSWRALVLSQQRMPENASSGVIEETRGRMNELGGGKWAKGTHSSFLRTSFCQAAAENRH